jgi:MFS family permease
MARHFGLLILGTFAALATFVLFYLMTVFALSWGISTLGFTRQQFLPIQMIGVVFFGLTIPLSAVLADRFGRTTVLLWTTALIGAFGLLFQPLFGSGNLAGVLAFMIIGLALMGLTYGPLGTALSEPFPVGVRYTGTSLAFNLAGIFGASLAPYVATTLATGYGITAVGYYLAGAAALTFLALLGLGRHVLQPRHLSPAQQQV